MKNIIIFDLDGTLALIDHRRHLVEKEKAFDNWYNLTDRPEPYPFKDIPNENRVPLIRTFELETNWKQDWDTFYDLCDKDLPNAPVIKMYDALGFYEEMEIYIFSGRSEVVRYKTTQWLNNHNIFIAMDHLFMRPEKDYTPDEELKKKWMEKIGGPQRIFSVFDDRDKVVKMWRSHDITCFQVAPGNF